MDNLSNYTDLCRVCLEQATNIFTLMDIETKQRFEICTSVLVTTEENFPIKLCAKCHNQLIAFSAFRTQAMDTNRRLKKLLVTGCNTKVKSNNSFTKDSEMWEEDFADILKGEAEPDGDNVPELLPIECIDVAGGSLTSGEESDTDEEGNFENDLSSDVFLSGKSNSQTTQESSNYLPKSKLVLSVERPYNCRFCDVAYKNQLNVQIHENEFHAEELRKISNRPFECDHCEDTFTTRYSLKIHQVVHNTERPFQCAECPKNYRFQNSLEEHEKSHRPGTESEDGQCLYCLLKFMNEAELQRHERKHVREMEMSAMSEAGLSGPKNVCPKCNERYIRAYPMRQHMSKMHPEEYKQLQEIKLRTEEAFERLGARKRFSCEICNKGFACNGHLQNHMAAHSNERPFKCRFCDASYKQKKNTDQHERTVHLQSTVGMSRAESLASKGEDGCLASATSPKKIRVVHPQNSDIQPRTEETLKKVQDSQKKNIPSKCDICGKIVTNLNNHMTSHSDERPFKCTMCDVSCKVASSLYRHERKFHGKQISFKLRSTESKNDWEERPFKCTMCDVSCKLAASLYRHERNFHGKRISFKLKSTATKEASAVLNNVPVPDNFQPVVKLERLVHSPTEETQWDSWDEEEEPQKESCDEMEERLVESSAEEEQQTESCEKSNSVDPFKCDKVFATKSTLKDHWALHNEEPRFKCEDCHKKFRRHRNLREHKKTHEGLKRGEEQQCQYCPLKFTIQQLLNQHERSHRRPPGLSDDCPICNKRTTCTLRHMQSMHPEELEEMLELSDDNRTASSSFKNNEESLKLETCNVEERSSKSTNDSRTMHGEQPCLYCPMKSTDLNELSRHELNHVRAMEESSMSGPKCVCSKCNTNFRRVSELINHMLTRHPNSHEKIKEIKLRTQEALKELETRKSFRCDICCYGFMHNASLMSHMTTHSDVRPFNCNYCDATFKLNKQALQHEREVHRALKSSEWEEESSTSATGHGNTEQERLRDEGSKSGPPFKCDQCEKVFAIRSTLRLHQAVHSDERPFLCMYCHKTFKCKESLVTHEKNHEGWEDPYFPCPSCDMSFKHRKGLRRHQQNKHVIE